MYYSTIYMSPIGPLTIACDEKGKIIGLWMEGQKYFGATTFAKMITNDNLPIFHNTKKWLDKYFAGEKPSIKELPLAPIGEKFRQDVWKILTEIPYGKLMTYGDIANRIAKERNQKSMSAQAVGGAVGHNPISIIIPCHRVVGKNKSLTGFSGGIEKKIKLLEHEGVDISNLVIPSKGTAMWDSKYKI